MGAERSHAAHYRRVRWLRRRCHTRAVAAYIASAVSGVAAGSPDEADHTYLAKAGTIYDVVRCSSGAGAHEN